MNRKGTGLVHIYFGDGKGKTTTGMGLCVRAAGYGYRVLIISVYEKQQDE